ncbi:MAG: hypothetical protein MZU97_09690 [Bacillus subtilis]|nr:hypothetical protein [Bacillus subtilis]
MKKLLALTARPRRRRSTVAGCSFSFTTTDPTDYRPRRRPPRRRLPRRKSRSTWT